jgi:tripartite-type tricarboxylate transporter receptor subunit TctC
MKSTKKVFISLITLAGILSGILLFPQVGEAVYPEKPLKFIVPWAAGGDTDAIVRIMASYVEKILGKPLIIVNITGASGTVGAREAKNSVPDGYTILSVHDSIHTTYYVGISDINYWDFEPIALVTSTPSVVATHSKAKWNSMKELLEDAKKRPGQITFGATLGSTSHFFPALIEKEVDIKWRYVSYEGTAPRMTALLGGHIDLGETNIPGGKELLKAGKLKLLAIATEKRSPELPDVPTLKELGINIVYAVNRGVLALKGTPEDVLMKLEDAFAKAAKDPGFKKEMEKFGTDVLFLDRKAYADFLKKNDSINAEIANILGFKRKK